MTDEANGETERRAERWPLRFREIEVPPDDPWQFDRLDRKRYGDLLTKLAERTETPFVLALDSAWGTGKTSFVRMWRQDLEKHHGFKTLYFNAWETDYVAEPLIALVGELGSLGDNKSDERFRKVKRMAGQVFRKGLPILARVATGGLVEVKDKDIEEALGEFVEGVVEEQIEEYEAQKQQLQTFRAALEDLVREVAVDRPVVFFIDELDRCRPSFAVELLERIKHLFEVPGMFFVLSTDRSQLAHSVRAVYGERFDGEEYLRRFVDLTYVLPEPPREAFSSYLLELTGIKARLKDPGEILTYLMSHLKFSLRKQERAVTLLALAARCMGDHDAAHPILPALVALRIWHPSLFQEFSIGSRSAAAVLEALEQEDLAGWRSPDNQESSWVEASFLAFDIARFDRRQAENGRGQASRDRVASHQQAAESVGLSERGELKASWPGEVMRVMGHLNSGFGRARHSWRLYFDAVSLFRGFVEGR